MIKKKQLRDFLLYPALVSLAACGPTTQQWGKLTCINPLPDSTLVEQSIIEIAYASNSLSIKESTLTYTREKFLSGIGESKKIKIHDICQYIDGKNWKCGVFQMQEGQLVKDGRYAYSSKPEDYANADISRVCKMRLIDRGKKSPQVLETPSTKPNVVYQSDMRPAKDPAETVISSEISKTPSSAVKESDSPLARETVEASESTQAMNVFLGQLAALIRLNVNHVGVNDGKLEAQVEISLTEDGRMGPLQLIKSSGNPAWDSAVMKAVSITPTPPIKGNFKMPKKVVFSFVSKE